MKMAANTRSALLRHRRPGVLREEVLQQIRIGWIKQAQGEKRWIANVKVYLIGDEAQLSVEDAKTCA